MTKIVKPSEVQLQLSSFLEQTKTKPFLHPDSVLFVNGPQYAATSGPNGGLAIHHLRRIEAGLRGENLVAETTDELIEQFGEAAGKPRGDDRRLDGEIARSKGGLKRARSMERVEQWEDGAEPLEQFEKEQKIVEGEIGERDGAPVVKQNGQVPEIEMADAQEAGEVSKKAKTMTEKAKRKEDKKARNKLRKAEKQAEG